MSEKCESCQYKYTGKNEEPCVYCIYTTSDFICKKSNRYKEATCVSCEHNELNVKEYPCNKCFLGWGDVEEEIYYKKKKEKEKKDCPECQRWIDRVKALEERLRKIREIAK